MDRAGWHMSNNLVVPENITILPLPPKLPELNTVENLWHFMRDNRLSNRVFKSYDDSVDLCCDGPPVVLRFEEALRHGDFQAR